MNNGVQLLRAHGLKATPQRLAILAVMTDSDGLTSAEEIYAALQPLYPDLCLSTVYRNLNLFVDEEILTRVSLADHCSHYRLASPGHRHHLICLGCNEVIELDHCPIHDYEQSLMKESHYRIVQHRLTFYGYCSKCGRKHSDEITAGR